MKRDNLKRLERTAYHEAGHVAVLLHLDMPFKYATIIPGKDFLGLVIRNGIKKKLFKKFNDYENLTIQDEYFIKKSLVVNISGLAAESRFLNRRLSIKAARAQHDLNNFIDLAGRMHNGNYEIISAYYNYILVEAYALFGMGKNETSDTPVWEVTKVIAKELLDKKTLTYLECRNFAREYHLNGLTSIA